MWKVLDTRVVIDALTQVTRLRYNLAPILTDQSLACNCSPLMVPWKSNIQPKLPGITTPLRHFAQWFEPHSRLEDCGIFTYESDQNAPHLAQPWSSSDMLLDRLQLPLLPSHPRLLRSQQSANFGTTSSKTRTNSQPQSVYHTNPIFYKSVVFFKHTKNCVFAREAMKNVIFQRSNVTTRIKKRQKDEHLPHTPQIFRK